MSPIMPDRVADLVAAQFPPQVRDAVLAGERALTAFRLCRTGLTAEAREYAISDAARANKTLAAFDPPPDRPPRRCAMTTAPPNPIERLDVPLHQLEQDIRALAEERRRAGLLAEQRHQHLDLDADSRFTLPGCTCPACPPKTAGGAS